MMQPGGQNQLRKILQRPDKRPPRLLSPKSPIREEVAAGRPSNVSAMSTDQVGEVDSDALSTQLQSKQTFTKPQLPRLRVEAAQLEQTTQLRGAGNAIPMRLPKPLHDFPRSTKNHTTSFKAFQTTNSSSNHQPANGGTPSSRALPHQISNVKVVTSPSYRDNNQNGAASIRTRFHNMASERSQGVSGGTPLMLSPTGGGRRDAGQIINTMISQQDDVPELEEDFRSVSTLYNPPQIHKVGQGAAPKREPATSVANMEVQEARAELEMSMTKADQVTLGPTPGKTEDDSVLDSFSRVFQKRRLANGEEQSASLATGERPWYYFEGNSMSSHNLTKQGSAMKSSSRYRDQPNQEDAGTNDRQPEPPVALNQMHQKEDLKQATGRTSDDAQSSVQEESSAGAVVDPLYSTSNVNTPNAPPKAKAQNLKAPLAPQVLQLGGAIGGADTISSGRMTLRSVHLSQSEELESKADQHQQIRQCGEEIGSGNGQVYASPMGSRSPKGRLASPLSKSSNLELPTATKKKPVMKVTDAVEDVNSALLRKSQPLGTAGEVNNLFITTEKKLGRPEDFTNLQVSLTKQKTGAAGEFVSPAADFKIRCNQEIVGHPAEARGGNPEKQNLANKILTPSFISSDMHAQSNQRRRSDLLIKKKEPSLQTNERFSLDGAIEDIVSSALNHSMCSNGNCLRESRFSVPQAPVAIQDARVSDLNKGRPVILNAGSPAAVQPNITDTESSMMLANSSKFSASAQRQMQLASQASNNFLPSHSHDFTHSKKQTQKRSKQQHNGSALRFSSSFSRRSIRKSTLDGDVQEVTSFAHHVQNFFYNLFGCCAGTGQVSIDKNTSLRHSLNSSMRSNVLQYSFVAVPNANSGSLASNQTVKNQHKKHEYLSRSKQIQDFRESQSPVAVRKQSEEVFQTQCADDDEDAAESDIIDDEDHIVSAQRPLQAARTDFRTPGDRIETSNFRADRQGSSRRTSSGQRVTAGTVEIATQISSDSHVDEFIYLQPAHKNGNPFQVRSQEQPREGESRNLAEADENGERSAPHGHPSRQQKSAYQHPTKVHSYHQHEPLYEVPKNLSSQVDYKAAEEETKRRPSDDTGQSSEHDYQNVMLPIGAMPQTSSNMTSNNSEGSQQKSPARAKKSLKDMITSVPQQQSTHQPYHQEEDQDAVAARDQSFEEGEEDEYGEEETLDVQKVHFNQTVQALFNIRMTNLREPPFSDIEHLLVNLPEPDHPSKTKTIVFDLDETLIHCVDDVNTDNPDVIIPIQFSEEPEPVLAGINIRPFARECLEAANQHFQVVVFTASEQEYADPIIDYLDPDGSLIQARYFRPSCVRTRNPDFYIKDMRIFHQRALSDIILVDNSVYSFAFQLDNGVPIVGFYEDPNDEEMLHLKFYLECLKDCEDVRDKNREAFQLMQLADTQLQRILEEQQRARQLPYGSGSEGDPYSPYTPLSSGANYRLLEQAQSRGSDGFIVNEDNDEYLDDEDDELERDPADTTQSEMQALRSASGAREEYKQRNSNILEEDYEGEEDESFECRL